MPSWNIHTAHVERLLSEGAPLDFGIADVNAFLFGNYVPDIYVGFMVPDASYRIDYCVTHFARPNMTPLPNSDHFWDDYVVRRRADDPASVSLALGAWAHLLADRVYNGRVRLFCQTHDVPKGEELRVRKQADFDAFGRSLRMESRVQVTPELLDAACSFRQYEIKAEDVVRSVDVADAIVDRAGAESRGTYQLLGEGWMNATFDLCGDLMAEWLRTWRRRASEGRAVRASDIWADVSVSRDTFMLEGVL